MNQAGRIEGFFIGCSNAEYADIKALLNRYEYTPDATGVKNLLLDLARSPRIEKPEPQRPEISERINEFIAAHPDAATAGITAATRLLRVLARRFGL